MTGHGHHPARWPWVAAILVVLVLDFVPLGGSHGCFDYAPSTGAESICSTESIADSAGLWVVGIVSFVAIAYFTVRLIRTFRAD